MFWSMGFTPAADPPIAHAQPRRSSRASIDHADNNGLTISIEQLEEHFHMAAGIMRGKRVEGASTRRKDWQLRDSELLKFVFGTTVGQYSFLALFASWLIALGAVVWAFGANGVSDYDTSFRGSLWLSWGIFFDPGTQTGLSFEDTLGDKFIVVVFSMLGFLFNLTFLGVIVDNIRTFLDRMYHRFAEIHSSNHVVILGWTPRTLFLINELMDMFEDHGKRGEIIVLGNSPRYQMQRAVELAFRRRHPQRPRGVRVRCWEGDTAEEDDLTRLSLHTARFVIALTESNEPRAADAQAVETVLALQSLHESEQCPGAILAELRTFDAVQVVKKINSMTVNDVLGVHTSQMVDMILSFTTLRPTVGHALVELTSFYGQNLMFHSVESAQVGRRFSEVSLEFPLCVVCGVRSRGELPVIAPPMDHVLRRGDMLLILALARKDVVARRGGVRRASVAVSSMLDTSLRGEKGEMREPAADDSASSAFVGIPAAGPLAGRGASGSAADTAMFNADGSRMSRQRVVVIGWRSVREMAALVRSLSKLLVHGSELAILSAVDVEGRQRALADELFTMEGFENGSLNVKHVQGSPMATYKLKQLRIDTASVTIVVGDPINVNKALEHVQEYHDGQARLFDARVFSVTALLRTVSESAYIVPVFSHIMSYRLLGRNNSLLASDARTHAFHRNALETGLIAMQANDPSLSFVYTELLGTQMVNKHLVFALTFDAAARELGFSGSVHSFNQLRRIVRRKRGHVLFGYNKPHDVNDDPVLNPRDKETALHWQPTDELLFFRASTGAPIFEPGETVVERVTGVARAATSGVPLRIAASPQAKGGKALGGHQHVGAANVLGAGGKRHHPNKV